MSSHVTILAAGTRGDVQPFHALTLAANQEFAELAGAYDVPYAPLRANYLHLADTSDALDGNRLTAARELRPMVRAMLDDAWLAAQDTDAIVYHPKTLAGPHLAERLGV